jgi:hypothetical protein
MPHGGGDRLSLRGAADEVEFAGHDECGQAIRPAVGAGQRIGIGRLPRPGPPPGSLSGGAHLGQPGRYLGLVWLGEVEGQDRCHHRLHLGRAGRSQQAFGPRVHDGPCHLIPR